MYESNTDYTITMHACYWVYFLLNKLETDSTYRLPISIRECLIDFVVESEIEWIKSGSYDDVSYYLINSGCGPIKDYADDELLNTSLSNKLYELDLNTSEQFLHIVKETLTPIEFIKHTQELTILKQMEADKVITADEALEIFGVKLFD